MGAAITNFDGNNGIVTRNNRQPKSPGDVVGALKAGLARRAAHAPFNLIQTAGVFY
jgi:hypothetical protein